jgi:hypothetical protein
MCDGDYEAATELAIGPAQVPGSEPPKRLAERIAEAIGGGYLEPTARELEDIGREIDDRHERMRRHPLAEMSHDYAIAGERWLRRHESAVIEERSYHGDLEVIRRDLFLIHVKIMRAQNDWNGSAKVSLISIDRSERAWRTIAATLHDEAATVLADSLATLRHETVKHVPRAMDFRRPGCDDAPRKGRR